MQCKVPELIQLKRPRVISTGYRNLAVMLSNHKNQENATQETTESVMASYNPPQSG